jgi:hypothetical protein
LHIAPENTELFNSVKEWAVEYYNHDWKWATYVLSDKQDLRIGSAHKELAKITLDDEPSDGKHISDNWLKSTVSGKWDIDGLEI